MNIIQGMKSKALLGLVATASLLSFGASSAQAAVVRGVHVTKGAGWVRVSVDAPGAAFRVHELPLNRAYDYRSIAIDVPGSTIAGGLEPKSRVPINEGLVSQVRVRQMGGSVQVLVDVIAFPRYTTAHQGSSMVIGLDTAHMRGWRPEHAKMNGFTTGGKMLAHAGVKKANCACCKTKT